MPLAGGVMGSKRPLSTSVGTVLVTGVLSTADRSRTRQAAHRSLTDWVVTAWSFERTGRTPGEGMEFGWKSAFSAQITDQYMPMAQSRLRLIRATIGSSAS